MLLVQFYGQFNYMGVSMVIDIAPPTWTKFLGILLIQYLHTTDYSSHHSLM